MYSFFVWVLVIADFVCLGVLWRCSACLQMSYYLLCIRQINWIELSPTESSNNAIAFVGRRCAKYSTELVKLWTDWEEIFMVNCKWVHDKTTKFWALAGHPDGKESSSMRSGIDRDILSWLALPQSYQIWHNNTSLSGYTGLPVCVNITQQGDITNSIL